MKCIDLPKLLPVNFLAHAYLAGQNPEFITGNLIADSINLSAFNRMPPSIQAGIQHHRMVDLFTDSHPVVASCRAVFFPQIRHYAAVIVDVLFDHFLAQHWLQFHTQPLHLYENYIYQILDQHADFFTDKFSFMYSRMKAHRWLSNYQYPDYIRKTIYNLNHRTPLFTHADSTIILFNQHYPELEKYFFLFFPQLSEKYKMNS
ncbi:MAG: DUF479 domain-containing protein [Candidatus Competibacteraceae bacterium]|nr:DUF479 domain-containing protein [Candidatus Competibacteraceae bacterium]